MSNEEQLPKDYKPHGPMLVAGKLLVWDEKANAWKEENPEKEFIFHGPRFDNTQLFDPQTHVAIKKPRWRKFSEELPEQFNDIYFVHLSQILPTLKRRWVDTDLLFYAFDRIPDVYWTYVQELDLTPLLPS